MAHDPQLDDDLVIGDCPFCGSGNVDVGMFHRCHWVRCSDCGSEGPEKEFWGDAVEAWNFPWEVIDELRADCDRLRRELDDATGVIR